MSIVMITLQPLKGAFLFYVPLAIAVKMQNFLSVYVSPCDQSLWHSEGPVSFMVSVSLLVIIHIGPDIPSFCGCEGYLPCTLLTQPNYILTLLTMTLRLQAACILEITMSSSDYIMSQTR
jgi:hypothetical protein